MTYNAAALNELNDKQREICTSSNNYVLTACPGSGKTRLITHRLAYLQSKYSDSRKYNIAITYTNRAADEIDRRLDDLGVDMSAIWCGTIHQFCMHFIIRPYAMYSDYLRNGYKIIDEYVTNLYCSEIAKELNINVGYESPLSFPKIKVEYLKRLRANREVDFDLILKLSLQLLQKNPFISENISAIIRSFHVDEFQDTNELQYKILAEIVKKNKNINVMFVGDPNQAIFGSLGATVKGAEEIQELFEVSFKEDKLAGCYRSTSRMIDYYTNFEIEKTGAFSLSRQKDAQGVISYSDAISKYDLPNIIKEIIERQIENGVDEEEICITAPQWFQLFNISNSLKELLPSLNFDSPDISAFKYDPLNPFYLLAKLLFTKPGKRVRIRKKIASEFLSILRNDFHVYIDERIDEYSLLNEVNRCKPNAEDGMTFYKNSIYKIFASIGVNLNQEESLMEIFNNFIEKSEKRIEVNHIPTAYNDFLKCFMEKHGIVINTIHGIKGEEYTTVIALGLLNGRLPNWEYITKPAKCHLRKLETQKMLYVLASRAKENLYLFSERGYFTQGKNKNEYTPTDELASVVFDYN